MAFWVLLVAYCQSSLTAACTQAPPAVSDWDTSGNKTLNGTYYFRYVQYTVADQNGDLTRAMSAYGTICFDGAGNYNISGNTWDSSVNQIGSAPGMLNRGGTYAISSSGLGFLRSIFAPGDSIWGVVSQNGVFTGSATETTAGYNDFFICAPLTTQTATTLNGTYSLAYINFPDGYVKDAVQANFQLKVGTPGDLGAVQVTAYQGSGLFPQSDSSGNISENSLSYFFSNGAYNFSFPKSGVPVAATQFLYTSPDASFVFGGSPTGWDIFVGVQTGANSSNFGGLYYQAGIDEDESHLAASGFGCMDSYYGSFKASSGTLLAHQRTLRSSSPSCVAAAGSSGDTTLKDSYTIGFQPFDPANPNTPQVFTDTLTSQTYIYGTGGAVRIGYGISPRLGINVALLGLQPPAATGPHINPTAVLNAGSYAPFTSGISPGELFLLYGSALANSTAVVPLLSQAFPTSLAGVQVSVNNIPAPLYYVTPNQIAAIVPYGLGSATYAKIQVTNSGTVSNTAWQLIKQVTPGVLTQTQNGIGSAGATHSNGAVITSANPSTAGEVVAIYLTGLGAVAPPILDGAAGSVTPLSYAINPISAMVGGKSAPVSFAGLAPSLSGLYQLNVTIPSGLTTGDAMLTVTGPTFQTSQATIPVH